ncbi:MAG: hypothetical protein ACO1RX_15080 [Candidatus Sericytochromatia bacterium]
MAAVRCKECAFVAKQNDGFCPECGAMYVEPLDLVDDSLAGRAPARVKVEKKKGGGLFGFLSNSRPESRSESPVTQPQTVSSSPPRQSALPEGVPREQIKMRCGECKELSGIDEHSGYCPNCGAFYVEPHDYVTPESLAAEREALAQSLAKYERVKKSFEEMDDAEKAHHLKEKVADIWDQIVKDRHVLNEKANECMQCFTAAGTIKSDDQYEVLASMLKQREHNLKDFEILNREYRQLLEQFHLLHDSLLAARQAAAEHAQAMRQAQPTT